MPNTIPLVRITTISYQNDDTLFATGYTQPLNERFVLEFDQTIQPNTNVALFSQSGQANVDMVTHDGGNVRTDMVAMAIQLRKFRALPIVQCNPYRFRVVRKSDPDRIVFCDPLPPSGYVAPSTPVPSGNAAAEAAVFVPPVAPASAAATAPVLL